MKREWKTWQVAAVIAFVSALIVLTIYFTASELGYPKSTVTKTLELISPWLAVISVGLGIYSIQQANSSSVEAEEILKNLRKLLSGVESFSAQQDAISRGLNDLKTSLANTETTQPSASSKTEATDAQPWSGADMAENTEPTQ